MAHQPFKHQPIDRSKNEIRLMRFEAPATEGPGDFISCSLHHYPLRQAPKFQALSYMWGPPEPAHPILVASEDTSLGLLTVRRNLYDFLNLIKEHPYAIQGHIWIDQICINQDDVLERNHQVQHMAEIYSRATRTLIWLGLGAYITEIAEYFQDLFQYVAESTDNREDGGDKSNEMRKQHKRSQSLDPWRHYSGADILVFLDRFGNHPYWDRMWIIEEILLAREVEIVLPSSFTIRFDFIARQTSFFSRVDLPPMHLRDLGRFRLLRGQNSVYTATFWNLTTRFNDSQCQDPRDKIYGIQGLLDAADRVEVNYTKSVEQVLEDAVVQISRWTTDTYRLKTFLDLAKSMLPHQIDHVSCLKEYQDLLHLYECRLKSSEDMSAFLEMLKHIIYLGMPCQAGESCTFPLHGCRQ